MMFIFLQIPSSEYMFFPHVRITYNMVSLPWVFYNKYAVLLMKCSARVWKIFRNCSVYNVQHEAINIVFRQSSPPSDFWNVSKEIKAIETLLHSPSFIHQVSNFTAIPCEKTGLSSSLRCFYIDITVTTSTTLSPNRQQRMPLRLSRKTTPHFHS